MALKLGIMVLMVVLQITMFLGIFKGHKQNRIIIKLDLKDLGWVNAHYLLYE